MSTNNKIVGSGQIGDRYSIDQPYFLAHKREPKDNLKSFTTSEIDQELYENRYVLKQRVWRNMLRAQRHPQNQRGIINP